MRLYGTCIHIDERNRHFKHICSLFFHCISIPDVDNGGTRGSSPAIYQRVSVLHDVFLGVEEIVNWNWLCDKCSIN